MFGVVSVLAKIFYDDLIANVIELTYNSDMCKVSYILKQCVQRKPIKDMMWNDNHGQTKCENNKNEIRKLSTENYSY